MADLSVANTPSPFNSIVSQSANTAAGDALGNKLGSSGIGGQTNLDQSDFIELLVAQVKNQDPTKPMDPSEFMNQLAQFSTVNGIQDLNTSFNSLAGQLTSEQALQAAGLVGRDVLIPGGDAALVAGGSISGQISLPQPASNVTLKVTNAQGEEVRSLPLGSGPAGELLFKWDGFEDDGSAAPAGSYRITAEGLAGNESQAFSVAIETGVNSVTLGQDNASTQLNLAGGGTVSLSEVLAIK